MTKSFQSLLKNKINQWKLSKNDNKINKYRNNNMIKQPLNVEDNKN